MPLIDTGERIRALRKQRGLNQDQLAELASLNRVTVAKYEAGRVEPGAQALVRIADALDVTVDEILGRKESEIKKEDTDVFALREQLRRDPNTRILFDAAMKAKPEHIRAAVAVLESFDPANGE